jgi:CRISPR/Cas system-associated endonuclease Cas1
MATEVDTQQKLADHEKRLQDVEAFVQEQRHAEQEGRRREEERARDEHNKKIWRRVEALKALKDDGCKTVDDIKKMDRRHIRDVEDQYSVSGFIIFDVMQKETGSLDDLIKKYGGQYRK